jgi:peptidoglycan/xylan/chitin deacetylase (PgdA/CDA1 family)
MFRSGYCRRVMLAHGRHVMKAVGAIADAVHPPRPGLVVLIYHRVGGQAPIETDLPVSLFEEQMSYLGREADVVSLDDGLLAVSRQQSSESSRIAVTFDDGTADFADAALPVLIRYRVPVTLYLATEFIEHQRAFPHGGRPLSWEAVRDALSTGLVSVGSHTHRHAMLDRLSPADVDDELDRSIELIRERLSSDAAHFAYPKAVPGSPAADRAVRARFRSAALAGTRCNKYGATDPYRLARSPVQVSDGMRWFRRKARGGLELEDLVRRLVNGRRYRSVTT